MKLSDFTSLVQAKAYSESSSRLMSPDMMLAYLTRFKLLKKVLLADTEEALAVQTGLQFGTEFNFIQGHPANVLEMLDQLITDKVATQEFKLAVIAYANPSIYPFADIEQAEFDLAKRAVSPSHQTTQEIEKNVTHVVQVTIDEPIAADDFLIISARHRLDEQSQFVTDQAKRAHIVIKANEMGVYSTQVNLSGLSRFIQYQVASKYQRNFRVDIVEV